MRPAARPVVALLALAAALLTACAPSDDKASGSGASASATGSAGASASATADACAKGSLQTTKPGTLTIATDKPVFEPWFVDDKPESGQGFEGAVAQAVATKLGFSASEVTWTRVPFNNVFKPTPKAWDFDINEFSITERRKQALDFSTPYYNVSQAVVTVKGTKAAGATSLADLKGLSIGAQVGTTSFSSIKATIAPNHAPRVYNSNKDVVTALNNGQIDALVTDLPTAFFMAAVQLKKGVIVGQLPASGTPEQFGLVLEKDSPLTDCVSKAVDSLREAGTLDQLKDKWLAQAAGAPVLQ
jgi:polar amino acid transport system substrate-binding protein